MIYEKPFVLSARNYHGREANKLYFSVSQVKSFLDCEARTMAELNGEWEQDKSDALLIGSYVDAAFESEQAFKQFCDEYDADIHQARTPTKLRAEYIKANDAIAAAKADPFFMSFLGGKHQVIRTGTLFGVPWKIKMDVWNGTTPKRENRRIVDLKYIRDLQPLYKPGEGKLNFADYWRYTLQGAIYQLVEGHGYPFFLAVITKEEPSGRAIIQVPQAKMDAEIDFLAEKMERIKAVKNGIIEPERCENCAYCRATRKLSRVINLDELDLDL